ncbi:MAG: hypothetical protein M1831_007052 [Alyxoria varia]|nr:MAG: hypothetical protein M1831_007052 [Alyxoria varia]
MSSPNPSVQQSVQTSSSKDYPFISHSRDTLDNGQPPQIDNEAAARQKRRRTSPRDQAVLEAEFQKNPKPSKASRRDIIERVSLDEKAVQIWFQNRRQSSRRKSAPQPHQTPLESVPLNTNLQDDATQQLSMRSRTRLSISPAIGTDGATRGPTQNNDESAFTTDTSPNTSFNSVQTFSTNADRSSTFLTTHERSTSLKRSWSGPRLSFTSSGSATIVQEAESSPSPPRLESASHLLPEVAQKPALPAPALPRLPSGRSRDSRAWEFWCDSESRGALAKQADLEQKGSAADAISLMRATKRSALAPIAIDDNSIMNRSTDGKRLKKGLDGTTSTAKLTRMKSSLASVHSSIPTFSSGRTKNREANVGNFELFEESPNTQQKRVKASSEKDKPSSRMSELGGSDSDKENFDPQYQGNAPRIARRRSQQPTRQSTAARTSHPSVLGKSRTAPVYGSPSTGWVKAKHLSHGGRRTSKMSTSDEQEEGDDDEVEVFMGIKHNAARGEDDRMPRDEDLDCVQGLLSLSQGNWG